MGYGDRGDDHRREPVVAAVERSDLVHQGARLFEAQDVVAGEPQRRAGQQVRAIGIVVLVVEQPVDDGVPGCLR